MITLGLGPCIQSKSEKCPWIDAQYLGIFSRVGPHRQVQQQYISEMEASLLRHPFELYPHLEESIDPEVLYEY